MLRYAAENGFDRLAWTTGEQQIARNSIMAMTARSVLSHKNPDGTWNLTVTDNKGAVHDFVDIAEQELTDVLGPKAKETWPIESLPRKAKKPRFQTLMSKSAGKA